MRKPVQFFIIIVVTLLKVNDLFAQPLSVTLTPPSGPPLYYTSLTAAYASIASPVTGNYLIELETGYTGADGYEVYPIILGDKGLSSGGFTITIRPAAGNDGETIQRVTPAAGTVVSINGGDNIILDGRPGGLTSSTANYLTINDPFAGSNLSRNVEILNGANNNTVQYLNAIAAEATSQPNYATLGSNVISISTSATAGNNNNKISNNIITGGHKGIQVYGTVVDNKGTMIINNEVKNFGGFGILAGSFQDNTTIQFNTVTNETPTAERYVLNCIQNQGTTTIANILDNTINISLASGSATPLIYAIKNTGSGTINILRNTISNISSSSQALHTIFGTFYQGGNTANIVDNTIGNIVASSLSGTIEVISIRSTAATTINIAKNKILNSISAGAIRGIFAYGVTGSVISINNNFISIAEPNRSSNELYGMLLTGINKPYTLNIYFNTVKIGGSQTTPRPGYITSAGIYRADISPESVLKMKNNILITERTGGLDSAAGFYNEYSQGIFDMDYNIFYGAPNSTDNSFAIGWGTNFYNNNQLAVYQAAVSPNEVNTKFKNVNFVSASDLHLAGASIYDPALQGVPIPGITMDIDGESRSVTAPTRGADEVLPAPCTTNNWTGNAGAAWENQANWSCGAVPDSNSNVIIGAGFTVIISSNVYLKTLTINNGSNLTVGSSYMLTILPLLQPAGQ